MSFIASLLFKGSKKKKQMRKIQVIKETAFITLLFHKP